MDDDEDEESTISEVQMSLHVYQKRKTIHLSDKATSAMIKPVASDNLPPVKSCPVVKRISPQRRCYLKIPNHKQKYEKSCQAFQDFTKVLHDLSNISNNNEYIISIQQSKQWLEQLKDETIPLNERIASLQHHTIL